MTIYLLSSLFAAIAAPIAVARMRTARGLFVHIGFIFFFQAMGALALSVGLSMLRNHSIFWAWFFFSISLNFYLAAIFFSSMARKHNDGAGALVIEEIRCSDSSEEVLLEKKTSLWPSILFPYAQGARAAVFTGRRWVNGIKASFGFSKITLTNKRILAQLLFPSVLLIDIQLSDIESAGFFDREKDIVGIRYIKSRVSPLTKLLAFAGSPPRGDTVLLNVGDGQRWLELISAHR